MLWKNSDLLNSKSSDRSTTDFAASSSLAFLGYLRDI
ncbi:hypothetical protein SAMN04488531_0702 [Corynebacterium coyleae]|nr:hypothetical protein CCOY_10585 [Corynebacterium coyleae]SEB28547.1 hypothetical protein SAMN04488531_0003 [Corynebacterium coyleae]SEB47869.1 hypothetical protein SAMN04488531_0702 [Corynebacterium coyleae]